MDNQNILFSEQKLPLVGNLDAIMPLIVEGVKYAVGARLLSPFERVIIAISGGAGAGKTHISNRIIKEIQEYQPLILNIERFYKEGRDTYMDSALYPEEIDFDLAKSILADAKDRNFDKLSIPRFNTTTKKREENETVPCGAVVIFEGAFALYPEFQPFLSLGIFIDALESVRLTRYEVRKAQHTDSVKETIRDADGVSDNEWKEKMVPAYEKYVAMQRKLADVIIVNNTI